MEILKDSMDYRMGLDIGSTTVKLVVLDTENKMIYSDYRRHLSDIRSSLLQLLEDCHKMLGDNRMTISMTGSGGLSLSKQLKLPFVQEVVACAKAVRTLLPETDVAIELGGEDAKITYFTGGMEQRMNGSCAGGTGAFLDQMAVLLDTDAAGLNEYAKRHRSIYPIASRCGVFAKTDIQPLINDGARKEDIAASILQAVANQTISGLACGKPIRGRIAFLGGPLHYLSELRSRFIESLKLTEEMSLVPEHSQLYVAIGAALTETKKNAVTLGELCNRLNRIPKSSEEEIRKLPSLFGSQEEYEAFLTRHQQFGIARGMLDTYEGHTYLGIDAGSTTTKLVLLGEKKELLFTRYCSNEGDPLGKLTGLLQELYQQLPKKATISGCTVTGYGEALVKAAFHADYGEIETIAHYKAAKYFLPEVDFILDIGGQDMKCLRIREGAISSILLNEACSSGCGSFLEGFAKSLHISMEEFVRSALLAKAPVDLGTKCTVFMNSKVKQAQKEGVERGDISAGLSYSVIKNAIYKVIKLRDMSELGKHILVQGGTFLNDAVLRAFELVTGRNAIRPEIAGLMGAFGAALIALERNQKSAAKELHSHLLCKDALASFSVRSTNRRCEGCTNQCLLTIHVFSDGERFTTGNRCEKANGAAKQSREHLPNLMEYKNKRTFQYRPLSTEQAFRGDIGIPRVLNLYENYPFWFTLFTKLGFRVILSSPSNKQLFERGMETVPSESTCYPAKLCHGHIIDLIERGVDTIFYPAIVYEKAEYKEASNHYNCPIVISYPEVIRNNIDLIRERNIRILSPFLSLDNRAVLVQRLTEELQGFRIGMAEMRIAVRAAYEERDNYKKEMQRKGEETLEYLRKEHKRGIVLCGKPYHSDPEINHGIADLINSYGMAVLTEDSIAHLAKVRQKLRVVDQWVYNSRLYRAAALVAEEPQLELIQLNSFGCGLDAVTSDQIEELLAAGGKLYTILKIDEGNNLGAIRIRIRSLKAAIEEREKQPVMGKALPMVTAPPVFIKEMRQTYTILAPQMAPIHFELVQEAAEASGYHMEVLPEADQGAVEEGLKYVNNDACFPAILMIGQLIQALKSGKYDLGHTAVILTQSGGGCRATNYIAFLKLGLKQAGFPMIPVISLNTVGLDKQPGFRLTPGLIKRSLMAIIYGDLFMRLLNRTRPYERFPGSAKMLHDKWKELAKENIISGSTKEFRNNLRRIVQAFDYLELSNETKPRVGIVGEILLKYHPDANHDIVGILEQGGVEAVVPDLMDYFLYSALNARFRHRYLAGSKLKRQLSDLALTYMTRYRNMMKQELARSDRFPAPTPIQELAHMASSVLSLGNQTGEGWLVAAEMMEFLEEGTKNILCVQPLACLPNHITGKGMFKPLRDRYPGANIMPIDYDPGLSYVNQLNRIKLMLSNADKE